MNKPRFNIGDETKFGKVECIEFWNVRFDLPYIAHTKEQQEKLFKKFTKLEDNQTVESHYRYGFKNKDGKIYFRFIHEVE